MHPQVNGTDNAGSSTTALNLTSIPNSHVGAFAALSTSATSSLPLEGLALPINSKISEIERAFKQTMTCFDSLPYPEEFPSRECSHTAKGYPELSLDDLLDIYSNLKPISFGSEHCIYRATLNYDREEAPKGTTIALRIYVSPKPRKNGKSHPTSLGTYGFLHRLRQQNISNYIAPYYGHYYAPAHPELGSYIGSEKFIKKFPISSYIFSYSEMEYMSSTYEKERFFYGDPKKPLTARIIVEETIGEWAVHKFAHLKIEDDKERQYGLVDDNHYLVYKIGERKYLFEPGFSPRRLDLDLYMAYAAIPDYDFSKEYNWEYRQSRLNNFKENIDLTSIKNYCEDLPRKGLIQSLYDNLKQWEVSSFNPIPTDKPVRYLELPIEKGGMGSINPHDRGH